jgi:formylglycine-generating enzyme required for sulfatase activity
VTPAAESPRPVPPTPVFQHPAPDSTEGASQVAFKPSSQGVSEEVSQDVMVQIPGARFEMIVAHTWRFDEGPCYSDPGEYGHEHPAQHVWLDPYWIDRTEVTNRAYHAFMQATAYSPADRDNFLAHWEWPSDDPRSAYPAEELAEHPVVYVDLNDARAYAAWAGKRLPTEAEWQFAAQGRDRRHWPWGWEFDPTRCNHRSGTTTPVTMYPSGASPHGVLDMAGNVWELTESERDDGHIHYVLLRSGSHLVLDEPRNEVLWYVATGAQPCWAHQKQLLLAPSLDRCATVGFRCVAPASSSSQ